MEHEAIQEVLRRIKGLPTLPETLEEMNRLVGDPDTTAREVGRLIASDPPVAAKTLKVVNSPFYGFPTRVTTITHAIVIMGFNSVRTLVLTSSIMGVLGDKSCKMYSKGFWRHCVATGAAAKVISQMLGYKAFEEFFIAGLLHDIGKIVISKYLEEEFDRVVQLVAERDILMYDAEEEVLHGATHADIAGALLGRWNLPRGLVKSVTYHHTPTLAGDEMRITSILHVADIMARALMMGLPGDRKIPAIDAQAWAEIGLKNGNFEKIFSLIDREVRKASVFLEIV